MKLFDFDGGNVTDNAVFPQEYRASRELFILCRTNEISCLRDVYGFDSDTVLDCEDLDESVRYTSYDGYDFVSLVHMELAAHGFIMREINLYISKNYLILVIPEHDSPRIARMEENLINIARSIGNRAGRLNRVYYSVFNTLLTDFSDMLESIEDQMETLSESILDQAKKKQFTMIYNFRKMAYTTKKQLRSLSYLGEQILVDDNEIIDKKQIHYFRNIDTRLKKLYDFAESLYGLGNELLNTYDSKMATKTNDTINKLTVITVLFAPLTLITGIYGMNFDYMPELKFRYGYQLTILIMVAISVGVYLILKKKKWI